MLPSVSTQQLSQAERCKVLNRRSCWLCLGCSVYNSEAVWKKGPGFSLSIFTILLFPGFKISFDVAVWRVFWAWCWPLKKMECPHLTKDGVKLDVISKLLSKFTSESIQCSSKATLQIHNYCQPSIFDRKYSYQNSINVCEIAKCSEKYIFGKKAEKM